MSRPSPGETVLDLGCGPAYYLGRLPRDIRYFGFDTSTRYIEHARKRWGDGPQFRDEVFTEEHVDQCHRSTRSCCSGCCTTSPTSSPGNC